MLLLQWLAWAARYNTWLLIKLTPKGVVFPFLAVASFHALRVYHEHSECMASQVTLI